MAVAADRSAFTDLLPDLLRGGNRAWAFGRGLVGSSAEHLTIWSRLVEGLGQLPFEQRDVQVLRGFLAELWERDRELAQILLDTALDQPNLIVFIPVLHSAVQLDARGVERLKQTLKSDKVPILMYRNLAFGQTTDQVPSKDLKDLLQLISEQSDGLDVALEILFMRLHADNAAQRQHEPEILEAGRELLRRIRFERRNRRDAYKMARVVRACLIGPAAATLAADIATRLRRAVGAYETYSFDNADLVKGLLAVQPMAVLDALFQGDDKEVRDGVSVFDYLQNHRSNPADEIPCETLVAWCSQDGERRFLLAASFVKFAHRLEESGPQVWSDQAKALLTHAPDPKNVLAAFVDRFRPMSGSGSLAAQMESNARLIDSLEKEISANFISGIDEIKAQLALEITKEREQETARDKARDERFE